MGDKKERKKSRNGGKRKQEKKETGKGWKQLDGSRGKNTDTVFPYLMASLSQD
jgi:hypothetical protein